MTNAERQMLLLPWLACCGCPRRYGALLCVHEETELAEMMIEIVGPQFEIITTVKVARIHRNYGFATGQARSSWMKKDYLTASC
jgi:hypothetical protein